MELRHVMLYFAERARLGNPRARDFSAGERAGGSPLESAGIGVGAAADDQRVRCVVDDDINLNMLREVHTWWARLFCLGWQAQIRPSRKQKARFWRCGTKSRYTVAQSDIQQVLLDLSVLSATCVGRSHDEAGGYDRPREAAATTPEGAARVEIHAGWFACAHSEPFVGGKSSLTLRDALLVHFRISGSPVNSERRSSFDGSILSSGS